MSDSKKETGALDRYDGEMEPHSGPATPVSHSADAGRGEAAQEVVGAARGSGSGAGGGGAPEDYDLDPVGGGGKVEQREATPAPKSGGDAKVGGSH